MKSIRPSQSARSVVRTGAGWSILSAVPGDRLPAVPGGAAMTAMTTDLVPGYLDVTRLALASFLARYREPTLTSYTRGCPGFG